MCHHLIRYKSSTSLAAATAGDPHLTVTGHERSWPEGHSRGLEPLSPTRVLYDILMNPTYTPPLPIAVVQCLSREVKSMLYVLEPPRQKFRLRPLVTANISGVESFRSLICRYGVASPSVDVTFHPLTPVSCRPRHHTAGISRVHHCWAGQATIDAGHSVS